MIEPGERITRYILSTSYFALTKNRVKARAFEPPPDNKTSVFRVSDLEDKQVWEIGQRNVADVSGRTLHARADLTASIIFDVGLEVEPDEPPPRHANIQGWPASKPEKMHLAQELAAKAMLFVNPDKDQS